MFAVQLTLEKMISKNRKYFSGKSCIDDSFWETSLNTEAACYKFLNPSPDVFGPFDQLELILTLNQSNADVLVDNDLVLTLMFAEVDPGPRFQP